MATARLIPDSVELDEVREHAKAIRDSVTRAGASNPRLIGPVTRGGSPADGRLQLLVSEQPRLDYYSLARLEHELSLLLDIHVDVVIDESVIAERREQIDTEALVI